MALVDLQKTIDCSQELSLFEERTKDSITPEAIEELWNNILEKVSWCISFRKTNEIDSDMGMDEINEQAIAVIQKVLEITTKLQEPHPDYCLEWYAKDLIDCGEYLWNFITKRDRHYSSKESSAYIKKLQLVPGSEWDSRVTPFLRCERH